MKLLRQWAGLLSFCLLVFSYSPGPQDGKDLPGPGKVAPAPMPVSIPAALERQLRSHRQKDDLSGWIYCQVQWVAGSPVTRATLLPRAVSNAWRTPRTNEEIQAWQDLLINEGYAFLLSGDIVRSTDSYTAAFQWARQHRTLTDEGLVLENILKPLGNNYTRLGDYEQALFIHRKALAISLSSGDRRALAGTYSNLANTASSMGEAAQSLVYCRKGLEAVGNGTALRGLLLSEQADAYVQSGETEAARKSIRQSIEALESAFHDRKTGDGNTGDGYWLLTAYQQAGDTYAQQPRAALRFYNKAIGLEHTLSAQHAPVPKRQKAKLFQRLSDLYARTEQPEKAGYWLDQCLSVLVPGRKLDALQPSDLYAENTLMDILYTGATLAAAQHHTDKALQLYRLCFTTEGDLRQELITGTSRERSVANSHLRYEAAIATAWEAWERTGSDLYRRAILEFMERSKARLLLDELLQQQQDHHTGTPTDSLEDRIRLLERALIYYKKEALLQAGKEDSLIQANAAQEKQVEWDLSQLRKKPEWSVTRQTDSFSFDDMTRILRHDNQLVRTFFAAPRHLYIVESGRDGIHFANRLDLAEGWQDSLRTFIHTYFEQGADKMINQPDAYYCHAYTIYKELFAAHPLHAGKEYILLPDGAMNLLPVEALVTRPVCPPSPENWPFVIRQTSLSYAWSLRTLAAQAHSPGNSSGFSGFFISGNPRGRTRLGATGDEQQGIALLAPYGRWYVDTAATTGAFRQALQTAAIVHISSHASSGKDSRHTPCLELYNEPFYLFELKDLEKHPAMVVLSACRTGDGRMVMGEGVQSLARAFTAGGADAVVAGWWNVNDAAAARLMQGFYRRLLQEGGMEHGAACLRQSKLDWLNDPGAPYLQKLPYYWAALNYSGDPELPPIRTGGDDGHSPVPAWAWWLLPGIILIMLAGLPVRKGFRR